MLTDKIFCIFQAAISTERLKALEWMERHNREKENLRDMQVSLMKVVKFYSASVKIQHVFMSQGTFSTDFLI